MKKLISLVCGISLVVFCLQFPVSAETVPNYRDVDCWMYSDQYIAFTKALEARGIVPYTSLEEFAYNFEMNSACSIEEYINQVIEQEISNASISTQSPSMGEITMPPEETASPNIWFDNIGTSEGSINIRTRPDYSGNDLRLYVSPGDILYETEGIVASITGHIAIIQGNYYSSQYNMYYIRTIESALDGVVFGVLDTTRYNTRCGYIYYSKTATASQINAVLSFCGDQLGKGYNLVGALGNGSCNTSRYSSTWYCTELVWAAYYSTGINLYGSGIPQNLYNPYMLTTSTNLQLLYMGS